MGYGAPIMERIAPVAQGIEHFSPKEGVGRSNRLGGTDSNWLAAVPVGCCAC